MTADSPPAGPEGLRGHPKTPYAEDNAFHLLVSNGNFLLKDVADPKDKDLQQQVAQDVHAAGHRRCAAGHRRCAKFFTDIVA